jgi:hypothetical protein
MAVPNLNIDAKNRIMEETKEVPLMVNGTKVKITLKKLTTGVRNKIRSECTKTTILAGQPQVKVDETEIQEKILAQAIISAPFDTSVEGIKKLPYEVTDYLFEEYRNFAEPDQKKTSDLEKQ